MPPAFCASATTCRASVVLPDDSGPKISTTRPRGMPPTPSAASKEMAPVEITEMGTTASLLPRRMIEPLPNCFSICETARSIARTFSVRSSAISLLLPEYGGNVILGDLCVKVHPHLGWRQRQNATEFPQDSRFGRV